MNDIEGTIETFEMSSGDANNGSADFLRNGKT